MSIRSWHLKRLTNGNTNHYGNIITATVIKFLGTCNSGNFSKRKRNEADDLTAVLNGRILQLREHAHWWNQYASVFKGSHNSEKMCQVCPKTSCRFRRVPCDKVHIVVFCSFRWGLAWFKPKISIDLEEASNMNRCLTVRKKNLCHIHFKALFKRRTIVEFNSDEFNSRTCQ